MPNVSVPASLYGGKHLSLARAVNVTLATSEAIVTVEVYHQLGASCYPAPYAVRTARLQADASLIPQANAISWDATVAYFNVAAPVAPSGAAIGGTFDFICESRHSIAR